MDNFIFCVVFHKERAIIDVWQYPEYTTYWYKLFGIPRQKSFLI